jgi:hypothetical protein
MIAHVATQPFVWAKDKDGNVYYCHKESIKDPKLLRDKEISHCIDDSRRPDNF